MALSVNAVSLNVSSLQLEHILYSGAITGCDQLKQGRGGRLCVEM